MKLTIFSRLAIGYLSICLLAIAVSIYAVSKLHKLEKVTRSILIVNNQLGEYEQKLSDNLMSLIRYEQKYTIIKDEGLYEHFLVVKKDFDRHLEEMNSIADKSQIRASLTKLNNDYQQYLSIFMKEVEFLKTGKQYPGDKYKYEKEIAVNRIMESLKRVKNLNQQNTYEKVISLSEAESNAKKAVIIVGIVSLVLAISISIFITLGITKPLSLMKKKTREIAKGNFNDDLQLSSPPEIKDLAQSINSMCARLRATDKIKSDFFSLMSHELRTPLTTIKEGSNLFLESMKDGKATKKEKRLLTIINEECNRLINLVNSLLDHSKMEAGMMDFKYTDTDLLSLINRVTREIEPLAETKKIRITINADQEELHVKADIERLLQVLRNLVGNAVKFTPYGGSVLVSTGISGKAVKLSIADSGEGISKEELLTIFDKYHQTMNEGSNKIKGTGLGLSIVKHIITAHGGKIWAESTKGQGSTFSFLLPV